ncbi:MAG: multifunctional 2',3'-cyclic-nucleotide 2'-phosphodiesterase/5'-nucleotidase/3'-nucleotidase, partial [Actinobacteria bacterium]|nr:multifunctional 2',3'-cyclic-nucleotide 2'-phosphodiesterase/5'-nucleotidase/3'-nucleotidase [Actinomycetota bacterium]
MRAMPSRRSVLIWAALLTMVAALLPFLPGAARAAGPAIFINEIHYDNAATDTGEAFEIAGPAGTSLAGWSVVLYNGNGGASYNTVNLAGTIPNQQGGFGTLSFAQAGIQNGAPDGLALVEAGSTVIEFLSYEGTFVAVGGPADGMSSVDIGVSESSSSPVGDSL